MRLKLSLWKPAVISCATILPTLISFCSRTLFASPFRIISFDSFTYQVKVHQQEQVLESLGRHLPSWTSVKTEDCLFSTKILRCLLSNQKA